jgi:hypothetical protein
MQYRYTLSNGYDRLLKKRIEKVAIFAVPAAVLLIVGAAAFTSRTFHGPGIGSGGKGGAETTQTASQNGSTKFQNTASHNSEQGAPNNVQQTQAGSSVNTQGSASTGSTGGTGSGSTTGGGGVASTGSSATGAASSAVTGGRGGNETVAPTPTVTHSTPTAPVHTTTPTPPPIQPAAPPTQPVTTTVTNQVSNDGTTTTVGNVLPVTVCTKMVANVCVN